VASAAEAMHSREQPRPVVQVKQILAAAVPVAPVTVTTTVTAATVDPVLSLSAMP